MIFRVIANFIKTIITRIQPLQPPLDGWVGACLSSLAQVVTAYTGYFPAVASWSSYYPPSVFQLSPLSLPSYTSSLRLNDVVYHPDPQHGQSLETCSTCPPVMSNTSMPNGVKNMVSNCDSSNIILVLCADSTHKAT